MKAGVVARKPKTNSKISFSASLRVQKLGTKRMLGSILGLSYELEEEMITGWVLGATT